MMWMMMMMMTMIITDDEDAKCTKFFAIPSVQLFPHRNGDRIASLLLFAPDQMK